MGTDHFLEFCFSRPAGALKQSLFQVEDVHALQIECQTNERPFAGRSQQAAQGKLAKAEDLFDDTDNRFDSAFAQTINCLSDFGLKFVSHLDEGAGLVCGWFGLLLETLVRIGLYNW